MIPGDPCPQGQNGMSTINKLSHPSVGEDGEQDLSEVKAFLHGLCLSLVLACEVPHLPHCGALFSTEVLSKSKG